MRSTRSILLVSLTATIALFTTEPARAGEPGDVTKHYCGFTAADFDSSSGHIQLNPDATKSADSKEILLTTASPQQTGTAFYFDALPLANRPLHVYFKAKIVPAMGVGGHGFTFLIQNSSQYSVGANLDGLGFGGIKPSVIFEFDTTTDEEPSGIDPPYLAMILDGDQTTHHSVGAAAIDPQEIHAWVDYDPNQHFAVYVSNTITKPETAVMWTTLSGDAPADLDLEAQIKVLDSIQGFIGFSAATGITLDKSSSHHILAWEFSNAGVPCECQGDSACAGFPDTPACSALKPDGETRCVECTAANATRCTMQGLVCDATTETCVECLTNQDCPADEPVCGEGKECLPCDCPPDKPHCETTPGPKYGECQECVTDADCKLLTAPICDTSDEAANICVPCSTNAQCEKRDPDFPLCALEGPKEGQCEPCLTDLDCTEENKPICDRTADPVSACRKCTSDAECEARNSTKPFCVLTGVDEGKCVPRGPECGEDTPCDCATEACCSEQDLLECKEGQIVGGGFACSTPAGSGTTTALGLGAALAALAGLARRNRRR